MPSVTIRSAEMQNGYTVKGVSSVLSDGINAELATSNVLAWAKTALPEMRFFTGMDELESICKESGWDVVSVCQIPDRLGFAVKIQCPDVRAEITLNVFVSRGSQSRDGLKPGEQLFHMGQWLIISYDGA